MEQKCVCSPEPAIYWCIKMHVVTEDGKINEEGEYV